jgi:predicted permease
VAHGIERVLSAFVLPGNITVSALRSSADGRLLLVALGLTMVAAVVVGLAPALRVSNTRLALDLKRQRGLRPRLGATPVLVAVQVAVSVVFVFSAVLFVRSLSNGLATDVGFDRHDLVAAQLVVPPGRMLDNAASAALIERVRRMPGVVAAVVGPLPLVKPNAVAWRELTVDGVPVDLPVPVDVVYASADFFSSLGQPVVAGRDFDERDREGGQSAAIVNEAAARRFWQGASPIGSLVGQPPPPMMRARGAITPEFSVVGVVGDVKLRSLRDADEPVIYLARAQHQYYLAGVAGAGGASLIVRANGDTDGLTRALPAAVAEVGFELQSVRPLDRAIDELLMPQRIGRTLLTGLGMLALALTAAGIYGLVSCLVVRSTKEIGVRLALGAGSKHIIRALSSKALVPVVVGAVAGSTIAWIGGRYVDRFMYGIDGSDPTTLAVAVAVIVASAAGAAALPTRRALRINPIETLRAD